METYVPPDLAQLIHGLPHVNLSLRQVSPQFDPGNSSYTESLLVAGSIPALWLVFTLLVLLVYLLTRCCCGKHKQRHSFVGLKWTLGFTAVLTCLSIAAGFYGNHTLHEGAAEFVAATRNIADTFERVRNETALVESKLLQEVARDSQKLQDLFLSDKRPSNASIVSWLDKEMSTFDVNVTKGVSDVRKLAGQLKNVQQDALPVYVRLSETIRWPATMGLLSLFALACLALLVGVIRHSRCLLITFSIVSLFVVILCFLLSSVHIAVTMGVADFCVWPDVAVRAAVSGQFPASLSEPALDYYLNCSRPRVSPWSGALAAGLARAEGLSRHLDGVFGVAVKYYPSHQLEPTLESLKADLNSTHQAYRAMEKALDCEHVHREYIAALNSLCRPLLLGLTVLLLALLVCGLLFTILAWCDSHAWIHILKRRDYLRVETIDPFLQGGRRPPLVGTAPSAPSVGGSLRSQRTSPHGSLLAARNHSTPPTLRTRTPPFPSAAPPSGPLLAFNGRMDEHRAGTLPLPRRYSPAPGGGAPPPSYTAALMQMTDASDYDNYS